MIGAASQPAPSGPVRFRPSSNPRFTIIVCVYNQIEATLECLRSIAECTPGDAYEVIVVDDCSDERTARALQDVGGLRLVRHPENRGFPAAVNSGAALAGGERIVLVNSDAVVHPGWLAPLDECVDSAADIGAAGARLLFPDGRLQNAGSIVFSDGVVVARGFGSDPAHPALCTRREVDYCAAAAMLMRADAFHAVGGMDRRFGTGYYDDVDLCFALRRLGYRVMYEPRSTVTHRVGLSFMQAGSVTVAANTARNRITFAAKWADVLERHHPSGAAPVYRGLVDHSPWVLVVTEEVEVPERRRTLVQMLRELGCEVTLLPLRGLGPAADSFRALGVDVWLPPYGLTELARERPNLYGTVLLSGIASAAVIDAVRRACPQARVVYDALQVRALRSAASTGNGERAEARPDPAAERNELAMLRTADIVSVPAAMVRSQVLGIAPHARVVEVPDVAAADPARSDAGRRRVGEPASRESTRRGLRDLVERRLA